ncbi:MAG: hypothetical protein AAF488_15960, partial [Planctomycetota bacterium]
CNLLESVPRVDLDAKPTGCSSVARSRRGLTAGRPVAADASDFLGPTTTSFGDGAITPRRP